MSDLSLDIQGLVESSQVPRRTIYFYVQQGILPPPQGAGLAAHYGEEHLLRLQLIPILRQRGLRLDEIRSQFSQWSLEDLRQAVQQHASAAAKPPSAVESALPAYLEPHGRFNLLPQPGSVNVQAQRYLHYALPAGAVLVAPEHLSPLDAQRLQQVIQFAQNLFYGRAYPTSASLQSPEESAQGPAAHPNSDNSSHLTSEER